ncbi:MAG: ATP-binding protein [Phycisphaerales bacterium JB037]
MNRRPALLPEYLGLGGLWAAAGIAWVLVLLGAPGWVVMTLLVVLAASLTALIAQRISARENARRRRLKARRARRAKRPDLEQVRHGEYRAILDGVDAPVLCTDPRGIVIVCNRATEDLFSARRGGLRRRPVEDVFTKGELLAMHEMAARGEVARGRLRLPCGDEHRIYDVAAHPLRPLEPTGSHRAGAVITFLDVTELATAMQLKADFVANASHELRTPLASIRGAIETLSDLELNLEPLADRLFGMIAVNSARLEELVRDLLDLSRLESPETSVRIVPFDAREMAQSLAPMFDTICAERDLELVFELPDELGQVESDRPLIELVLKNLIENATKYARESTKVRVRAGLLPPEEGSARRGVRFEVIDQGQGIPLQHQQRVFERFYQVDEARTGAVKRGTGLGLAIVKHAMKLLGGQVGLESVWQEGTTFWIELPGCVPPPGEPGEERARTPKRGPRRLTG